MAATISIVVVDTLGNPNSKTVAEGTTVRQVMSDFGVNESKVRVRLNGAPCSDFTTVLTNGASMAFSPAKTDSAAR